jgi:hypothetical protein
MKAALTMRRFLLALIITATANTAMAADVAIDDIIGRWCVSDSGNTNTFTRTKLFVESPKGWKRTLEIAKIEAKSNQINIYWSLKKANDNTVYELSADKRTLVQLPNTAGDMGPRRELHRC